MIIIINKKALILTIFILFLSASFILVANYINTENISTFITSLNVNEPSDENHTLKNLLDSLMHQEQKIIYEYDNRTIYKNASYVSPSPLSTHDLNKVISHGVNVNYKILSNDQLYKRPLYDPSWKWTYYRGWLNLPLKNMEARHKMFSFSIGLSMNYDIFGSLGYEVPNTPIDSHKNINLLIYGFNVKSVKLLENQVALIGEPKLTGAQIVSITQNDLLSEDIDTKDFVFQLSTPDGYELDFLRENIIRYEYLMKKIKQNTVGVFNPAEKNPLSKQFVKENQDIKESLSLFIPLKDEIIYQKIYGLSEKESVKNDIKAMINEGKKIPFFYNYKNIEYKRPLYHPTWKENYKRKWCYIPKQIEFNIKRLLIIPENIENRKDFLGTLGFFEKIQPFNTQQYSFMVYNFDISYLVLYKDQLLMVGIPSRKGAQIISVNKNALKAFNPYQVKLITPDNYEIDVNILNS